MKYIPFLNIAVFAVLLANPAHADESPQISINLMQLRADAEKGDVDAQLDLAEAYHEGKGGIPQDDAESVNWYRKAAQQGELEGEYNLGIAYYRGIGVKKDIPHAVKWFRRAADKGFGDAQYIVAAAYQNGLGGLPKDLVQSHMWLSLAENQGSKEAARERIQLESTMKPEEIEQSKQLISQWKPKSQIQ